MEIYIKDGVANMDVKTGLLLLRKIWLLGQGNIIAMENKYIPDMVTEALMPP